MKMYNKPKSTIIVFQMESLMVGGSFDADNSHGTVGITTTEASGSALTRQNHGIGGGLWEDMK